MTPRPLRDLALMVVLALALASIAFHVATAGRDRSEPEIACPDPNAPLDVDGCPEGSWGYAVEPPVLGPDDALPPPVEMTRAEVCAEVLRRCADR